MGDPVKISAQLDVRYLKAGEYSLLIPVPDETAVLIGRIAIGWGGFEQRLDGVMDAMFASLSQQPVENWRKTQLQKAAEALQGTDDRLHETDVPG